MGLSLFFYYFSKILFVYGRNLNLKIASLIITKNLYNLRYLYIFLYYSENNKYNKGSTLYTDKQFENLFVYNIFTKVFSSRRC